MHEVFHFLSSEYISHLGYSCHCKPQFGVQKLYLAVIMERINMNHTWVTDDGGLILKLAKYG